MSWSDFFYMGGYAFEVWTSWGLTLMVLVAFVIIPKRRNANIRSQIKRQISREQRESKGESS
ncbi:MAG: heme exporter protein D [Arenicella sp.]|jgi:heme exporter protein D